MVNDVQSMDETSPAGTIADVALVRAHLVAAARRHAPMSYSELLLDLGHRFTRPSMRALCRTLDAIDRAAAAAGEPDLAVLVVRESDNLPGQGWWAQGRPMREGYDGPWSGPQASAFVRELQARAFDRWAEPIARSGGAPPPARAMLTLGERRPPPSRTRRARSV